MRNRYCLGLLLLALLPLAAVKAQPTITTSTGIAVGSSSSLSGVAYGSSRYVTVGAGGKVYSSANGTNWSVVNHAAFTGIDFTDIRFGNNLFVASGSAGQILTSPDGLNWTARTSGTSNRINKLAFLNNLFFAIGNNGTLLSSSDGSTWTAITVSATTYNLINLAWGNGVYVLAAQNAPGGGMSYTLSSTTAASNSWTLATFLSNGSSINNVQFLKDRFWAVHSGTEVYTSTNGSSWTSIAGTVVTYPNGTTGTINSPNMFFNGIYDGSSIYFFGSSSYHSGYGGVFTSTTGSAFTLQPKTNMLVTQASAYVGGRYFILGNEGMVTSDNGSNWGFPGGSFNALATNGSNYVAVSNTSSTEGQTFTSADFSSWSNTSPGFTGALYGVCWGGNKYVAVGASGLVVTSTDGTSWTQGSTGDADFLRAVTYGGGRFVAVGTQGKISYSPDGISWTQARKDLSAGSNFYQVYYLNGRFIAVGGGSAIGSGVRVEYSADGISWTAASPSISGSFSGLAWTGSKYLLTGRDNTSGSQKFFSVTVNDITNAAGYSSVQTIASTSTGGIDLGTVGYGMVAYSNGRFVAFANQKSTPFNAYILESADGSSWQAWPAGTTSRLRGMVNTGSMYRIVGTADTKLTVSYGTVLPLRLEAFTAIRRAGGVQLQWQTSGEVNTDRFLVERSDNGETFVSLGAVVASGTGDHSYSFTDAQPLDGRVAYRLKMIDRDGRYTYSEVRSLVSEAAGTVQVYPVPVRASLHLRFPEGLSSGQVRIYNASGQQVLNTATTPGIPVATGSLQPGTYHLELESKGKVWKTSFVKF